MCLHDASKVPGSIAWPIIERRRDEIDRKIDDDVGGANVKDQPAGGCGSSMRASKSH